MIRIYYPTPLKTYRGTPYYQPIINAEQRALKAKPSVKREDIEKLAQLKSHTVENASIVKKVRFPVVLFISGLGGVAQLYENFITQLVSHGYIVVGINSAFINGDIVLPNNKLDFFNTFLKDGKNPFKDCVPLTRNTVLECGPGIF